MKENEREESKGMTEKEQITFLIDQYTDLQRIKVANEQRRSWKQWEL